MRPSTVAITLFVLGWASGWLALLRPRRLGFDASSSRRPRPAVAVVIPARDEERLLPGLLGAVLDELRPGDELIVVDDHSRDATAALARRHGAAVLPAPDLPPGWAGKPHACHIGAVAATAPVMVFLDADVRPSPGLLDALVDEVERYPDALVSVQPWHRPEGVAEQASLVFNIVALMGSGAFGVRGPAGAGRVAYGPVLACRRDAYDAAGGHAHPEVRAAVLEDIALARRFANRRLYVGSPTTVSFRMYPLGLRQLVEGWGKGMGIGLAASPRWAAALSAAWVASLAGGWMTSPWFWLASAVQVAVLGRVAGRWSPLAVIAYPVAVAVFVAVAVRSALVRGAGGSVSWKGRRLRPDQPTG